MSSVEEEEYNVFDEPISAISSAPSLPPIPVCKCLLDDPSVEVVISKRKKKILSTVARTEGYLRDRRIPELLRFILTKVIANRNFKSKSSPTLYSEKLLNECMLYRAGHGPAPVLFQDRHLEAVVKSFDPGERGWLSAGQVKRAFHTLGFTPEETLDDRIPNDVVFNTLRQTQERELFELLTAGMDNSTHSSQ